MFRLAKRRSRKPFYLLSTVYRRRLEKLERDARNKLLQKNLKIASARVDSDSVDKGQILAESSQPGNEEIAFYSNASSDDMQFDEASSSSDAAKSTSDSDDALDTEPQNTRDNFQERLAEVFVVRTHPCLSTLPKDCRTLLKTPRITHLTFNIAGDEYLHLGFEAGILFILEQTSPDLIPLDTLMIDFSTDGATLDGCVAYRGIQHRLRTDEEYRNNIDGEHHTESESALHPLGVELPQHHPSIIHNLQYHHPCMFHHHHSHHNTQINTCLLHQHHYNIDPLYHIHLQIIMDQLHRMEERQISIENKTDENAKTIKRLLKESTMKRPTKPQEVSFKIVDDFLAFEEVDEEINNDLVGDFIYLGQANSIDCATEYFCSVFPEDEEVSSHLILNGKSGQRGGCKLRDSRFAQACQDAMNSNKYFINPNNVEFYDALEKALKSLKTRKWRYNKKRRQENEEDVPPNRCRRIDNKDEKTTEFEDIVETEQEIDDDENLENDSLGGNDELTETQHTEETEEIEDTEDALWNEDNIAEEIHEDAEMENYVDDDKIQEDTTRRRYVKPCVHDPRIQSEKFVANKIAAFL
ncbi:uncharacterized protein LOC114940985 [Nylanderia fulva]|uniref:uncharacterized protein LOC114940985 n=1 Tax=Nylanderia fulva TaxID=613905 RepID=UPI0010FB448B|nr:uncharacterized protein LOC114940985 [Nylanderia fulva]